VSTKTDFQNTWAECTGEPVREVRHRIRQLSEAGLLPVRGAAMTFADLARAILAFVGSETHKDAPAAVCELSELRCGMWEPNGDARIVDARLLDAVAAALQPPFWLISVSISLTARSASLIVARDGDPTASATYWFSSPARLALPAIVHPVRVERSIGSVLIGHLTVMINRNETAAPLPGRTAELDQDRATGPGDTQRPDDSRPGHSPQLTRET